MTYAFIQIAFINEPQTNCITAPQARRGSGVSSKRMEADSRRQARSERSGLTAVTER